MASLIDKLRSSEEKWASIQVHGFDPDMRICGHSILLAHYRTDVLGVFKIDTAIISRIEAATTKLTSIKQANAMTDAIHRRSLWNAESVISFVESQQAYADSDVDFGEANAKANDLIRLAHISGAYHMKALAAGHQVQVMLPCEWKGNRPKPAMHRDVIEFTKIHSDSPSPFRCISEDGTHAPFDITEAWLDKKDNFHSMDALCLAYKGLVMVSRGEVLMKRKANGQ